MSERTLLGGTDGFRGPVDLDSSNFGHQNEQTHYWMTAALTELQVSEGQQGPVVILRDTRPSGYRLMRASIQAAEDLGCDVLSLDVAPTPVGQKVAELSGAIATIAITASHNPVTDNGWKGMVGSRKPGSEQVQAISDRAWELYESKKDQTPGFPITAPHVDVRALEYKRQYQRQLVTSLEETFGARPLDGKILIYDGANGAGSHTTPDVLEALGADVQKINCGEGIINDNCGAAQKGLSSLKLAISSSGLMDNPNFLGGLANDGDADRLMAVGVITHKGNSKLVEINGNHAMYELAQGETGIVGTIYTNTGLRTKLKSEGIAFEECGNGDKYVTEVLLRRASEGWRRGGEFTGHLIDMDWLTSGDGVAMAAWLSSVVAQKQSTFGDLYHQVPLWHECMKELALPMGTELDVNDPLFSEAQLWARDQMAGEGRSIVRPSGTEPVVRVWVETPDSHYAEKVCEALRTKLRNEILAAD